MPPDLLDLPPDDYLTAEELAYLDARADAAEALLVPDVDLPERAACRGMAVELFYPERRRRPDGTVEDSKATIAEVRKVLRRAPREG